MSTRINIRVGEGLIIDLRLQPAACCLIAQWQEPGFAEPWRYKIPCDIRGIHYPECLPQLPRLGAREERRVMTLIDNFHQLPF